MPKVLKSKHKSHIWRDSDGDIWFYDVQKQAWTIIMRAWNGCIIDSGIEEAICGPFKKVK